MDSEERVASVRSDVARAPSLSRRGVLRGSRRPSGTVVVVGAGPAGLAVAAELRRAGVEAVVIERATRIASSWRGYYESLRLNSPRRMSSLPGTPIKRSCGRWVARNDFIAYLEHYARPLDGCIRFGVVAHRIDRAEGGWRVDTSDGALSAGHVVVATGLNAVPAVPDWPGRAQYERPIIHATEYRNARGYNGCDALVIGVGSSGTDLALELIGVAASVSLSVRTPPIIYPASIAGVSTAALSKLVKRAPLPGAIVNPASLALHRFCWGDLSEWGLPHPPEGLMDALDRRGHGATIDRGLVGALKGGRIHVVAAAERFDKDRVVLADGTCVRPDVVIAATGQRPDLDPLVGHLGVLGRDGRPLVHGGATCSAARGLYFIGFRLPAGQLMDLSHDARVIAGRVSRNRAARGRGSPGKARP